MYANGAYLQGIPCSPLHHSLRIVNLYDRPAPGFDDLLEAAVGRAIRDDAQTARS